LSTYTRTNTQIRAKEVRLIDSQGENIGIVSIEEALKKAEEADLDLIEISAKAKPPIAKIADYGKFLYNQKKKEKEAKAKTTQVEVKSIQVKLATGEHDLALKAKRASQWLSKGNRVKVELFLRGREKYMDRAFLETRLDRVLKLITEEYKVADGPKKGPKGLVAIIEKV